MEAKGKATTLLQSFSEMLAPVAFVLEFFSTTKLTNAAAQRTQKNKGQVLLMQLAVMSFSNCLCGFDACLPQKARYMGPGKWRGMSWLYWCSQSQCIFSSTS
jgi:hypothetical protein